MKRNLGMLAAVVLCVAGIAAASENPITGTTTTSTTVPSYRPTIEGASTVDLMGLLQRQGIFDQERVTTWRTYSFGMAMGGGQTTSGGLLVQHMQYQLSKPLTLHVAVGLEHNPLGMAGMNIGGPQQANLTIPSVDLIYRPSDSFVFSFHYSQIPSYGYDSAAWWEREAMSPYSYSPRW